MKNLDSIILRSEFRKDTAKIFRNSEENVVKKQFSNPNLIAEAARAAFFDVDGIESIDFITATN